MTSLGTERSKNDLSVPKAPPRHPAHSNQLFRHYAQGVGQELQSAPL